MNFVSTHRTGQTQARCARLSTRGGIYFYYWIVSGGVT